jgi:hypothetical protein
VTSHDLDQGDADNHVALGVTQGAPAASPARPAAPAYATVLAYMRLPAGATTTAQATVEARGDAATASGGTLGLLGEAALNAGRDVSTGGSWSDFYTVAVTVTVPSRHVVRVDYRATLAVPTGGSTGWTRVRPYLTVDGAEVAGSRRKWPAWAGPELTHSSSCVTELPAGTHTVELHLAYDGGDWGLSIVDGGTGGAALSGVGRGGRMMWSAYLFDSTTGLLAERLDLPSFSWTLSVGDCSLSTTRDKGAGVGDASGLRLPVGRPSPGARPPSATGPSPCGGAACASCGTARPWWPGS